MISLMFSLVWLCFFFGCLCKFNLVLKTTWQNLHSNLRFKCLASICLESRNIVVRWRARCVHATQKTVATHSLRIFLFCDETKQLLDIDIRKVSVQTILTGKKVRMKVYCNKEVSVSKSDSSRWYVMISLMFSLVWPCFFFRCLCKFNLVLKTTWQNLHSNLRFRCLASICRETSLLDEALYPQTVHQEQFLSFINKLWTSCTPKTNRKGFVHTKRSFNSDKYIQELA